jgi:hypothetical protein
VARELPDRQTDRHPASKVSDSHQPRSPSACRRSWRPKVLLQRHCRCGSEVGHKAIGDACWQLGDQGEYANARCAITETNRTYLYGIRNRASGSYLAATHRILIPVMTVCIDVGHWRGNQGLHQPTRHACYRHDRVVPTMPGAGTLRATPCVAAASDAEGAPGPTLSDGMRMVERQAVCRLLQEQLLDREARVQGPEGHAPQRRSSREWRPPSEGSDAVVVGAGIAGGPPPGTPGGPLTVLVKPGIGAQPHRVWEADG